MFKITRVADFPGRFRVMDRDVVKALDVTVIQSLMVAHREQILDPNSEKMIGQRVEICRHVRET